MLELYLIRHGKTVFNTIGRLQGWSDSPLTNEGRAVAENLGQALKRTGVAFDAAFASTSPRAADTAQLILQQLQPDLPLQQIASLREYCFGGLEGERTQTIHEMVVQQRGLADVDTWLNLYRHAEKNLIAESVSMLDPLGLAETEAQFVHRLQQGLAELVEKSPQNGRVMLVSHGMAITAILKMIDPKCTRYQSVPNVSVSRLIFADKKWQVSQIGQTNFN